MWRWIGILCVLVLVGCQSDQEGVVLRVASWGVAGDDSEGARIEREVFEEFERLHSGVEIQLETIPSPQDYVKKILLSFIAKSEPDVMRLDASSAAVFIENDVLWDMREVMDEDGEFDLGDYYENVVGIARREESVYAVPADFTPMVVYYNKALFDKAGVSYPEAGWTWDQFLEKAKALTGGDQHGFTFTNWMPGWILWIWNNGGDVLGDDGLAGGVADQQEVVEAVTFLRDLVGVHGVAPSLSAMAAQGVQPFANGQAAMEISGHWHLTTLANSPAVDLDAIGVVEMPVAREGMESQTVIYESGWAIGENCEKKELAWEFVKYMTSEEVQRKIQQTGVGICARKDIAEERAVDDREKVFLSIVPSGRMPWGASVEGYDYVESEGQKMMDAVLKSGRDPAEALREFARRVDRQLGDE